MSVLNEFRGLVGTNPELELGKETAMKTGKRNGWALILMLILILLLSVMGASLMFLSKSETWASMNYRMMTQSRYGAEAGVNTAANFIMYNYTAPSTSGVDNLSLYKLDASPVTLAGTSTPVVLSSKPGVSSTYPNATAVNNFHAAMDLCADGLQMGNSNVKCNAVATLLSMGQVNIGTTGSPVLATVQTWQLTADGSISSVRNSLEEVTAIMEQQVVSTSTYAVFTNANQCGSVRLTGGSSTDSYDSSTMTLSNGAPVTDPYGGNVGSNGNLNESGGAVIYGTFSTPRTGVGSCANGSTDAWTDSGRATVTGGLVQLSQPLDNPTPFIPPPGTTNISGSQTITPGSYGDITLTSWDTLHVTPNANGTPAIYNVNSISETAQASIILDPIPGTTPPQYGPVIFNITGNNNSSPLTLTGQSLANPTFDPSLFIFNYAGTGTITLTGGSAAAFVFYGPNSNVSIAGHAAIYGSVIASTYTDVGGAALHFDRHLNRTHTGISNWMLDTFSWVKF